MFSLTVKTHFDAAHNLRNYQGKCARIHGHTWEVEVIVKGSELDEIGMLIDFSLLKNIIRKKVSEFDHQYLNEIPTFKMGNEGALNPTAENIAFYLYKEIKKILAEEHPNIKLHVVRVWESPGAGAAFGGEDK